MSICTALGIKSEEGKCFFGRNMDLAYNFNKSVMIIPKKYSFQDKVTGKMIVNNRTIIGMGTVINNHPAMADGMNENRLACAGLNFAGYAYYEDAPIPGKVNIAPYDFIQWILSNHDTVEEVKSSAKNIELVNIPINRDTQASTFYWMISDKSGKSIVVEKTKKGITVYDNPTFDWHLTNLNEYINITPEYPKETTWSDQISKLKIILNRNFFYIV